MKTPYRAACAVAAWATLIAQYTLLLQRGVYGGWLSSSVTYFGYFTIWTNILVALAFTAPFLKPRNRLRVFFDRQAVRAAIALYILIVAVVYYALLFKAHNPQGLGALTNMGLHLILPILYIIDWLVFAHKDKMSYKSLPFWILYPLAYGLFNIARGLMTGFYPYPFLDISSRGVMSVTIAMVIFTAIYAVGGLIFIRLGRSLPRPLGV